MQLDRRSSVFPILLAVWKGNLYPCTTAGLAWLARCICGRGNRIPLTHRVWVVTARSRMLGLSGQRSDLGQQSLCSPAWLMGEIFCLISALLLAAGSREKGGMASCRARPYKAGSVGWKVPCSLARKSVCGGVCVCSGGSTSGKQWTCPNKQKAKTSPSSAPWETLQQMLPVTVGPCWESHG